MKLVKTILNVYTIFVDLDVPGNSEPWGCCVRHWNSEEIAN